MTVDAGFAFGAVGIAIGVGGIAFGFLQWRDGKETKAMAVRLVGALAVQNAATQKTNTIAIDAGVRGLHADRLAAAIAALPEREQLVLRLHSQGLSYDEIGDILGRTDGLARSLHKRALSHVRENARSQAPKGSSRSGS